MSRVLELWQRYHTLMLATQQARGAVGEVLAEELRRALSDSTGVEAKYGDDVAYARLGGAVDLRLSWSEIGGSLCCMSSGEMCGFVRIQEGDSVRAALLRLATAVELAAASHEGRRQKAGSTASADLVRTCEIYVAAATYVRAVLPTEASSVRSETPA